MFHVCCPLWQFGVRHYGYGTISAGGPCELTI
jgi:hypothetical protein